MLEFNRPNALNSPTWLAKNFMPPDTLNDEEALFLVEDMSSLFIIKIHVNYI